MQDREHTAIASTRTNTHHRGAHARLAPLAGLMLAAGLATGCDPSEQDLDGFTDPEEIREAVLARSDAHPPGPTDPARVPSMVVPDTTIRVLVSEDFAEEYAEIDPDRSGSEIVMPPEALIIRQLYAADGALAGFTMITTGAPLSNDDAGDLWFGVLDADGRWTLDEDGDPMYGAIASCSACHAQREADGFLFGLPRTEHGGVIGAQ